MPVQLQLVERSAEGELTLGNLTAIVEVVGPLALAGGLLAISISDLRRFRIPDMISLPLIGLGTIYWVALGNWMPSVLGAALGYLSFRLIETAYRTIRAKEGLGRGDAKLLAAGGAWCGVLSLPSIVLIASVSALAYLVVSRCSPQSPIPFGPFLSAGILIVFLSGFRNGFLV